MIAASVLSVNGNGNGWRATKEKILMFAGLAVIGADVFHAEVFAGPVHLDILVVGLALCGVSLAQWGDKK